MTSDSPYPLAAITKDERRRSKQTEGKIIRTSHRRYLGKFEFEAPKRGYKNSLLKHNNFSVSFGETSGVFSGEQEIEFYTRRKNLLFREIYFCHDATDIRFYSRLGGSHPDRPTEWFDICYLYISNTRYLYNIAFDHSKWTKERLHGGGYTIDEFANQQIESKLGFDLCPLVLWDKLISDAIPGE